MSVDLILSLGDDAMANQFILRFPQGIPGGGSGDDVALRLQPSFDPPADVVGEYEVPYRGMKIMKTSMLDETDKHLTFEVRLDQQWSVFDDLQGWKDMVYNSGTGTGMPQSDTSTTLLVQAMTKDGTTAKSIRYGGVVVKSVKVGTFDHSAAEPILLTLEFIFNTMKFE